MKKHVATRAALEVKLAELMVRHSKLDDHLHNRTSEVPQDSGERATFRENDEVMVALDDKALEQISAIRAAIKRIDHQTYGVCLGCDEPINPRRLEALPAAALCTSCASN